MFWLVHFSCIYWQSILALALFAWSWSWSIKSLPSAVFKGFVTDRLTVHDRRHKCKSNCFVCWSSLICIWSFWHRQVVFRAVWDEIAIGADKTDTAASRRSEAAASDLGWISTALWWHTRLGIPGPDSWPSGWRRAGVAEAGRHSTVHQFSLSVSLCHHELSALMIVFQVFIVHLLNQQQQLLLLTVFLLTGQIVKKNLCVNY